MANYGNIFKALVVDSDPSTGNIEVVIPSVVSADRRIAVTTVGRTAIDGIWKVPAVGEVVFLASEDDNLLTLSLIPTYTYDSQVRVDDIYGDLHGMIVVVARNDTASTIAKNTPVCGQADGADLVLAPANANDLSKVAIGIAIESIAPDAYGKVAVAGVLEGINTSTFAANIDVFLGPTGTLVSTPVGLTFAQIMGRVLKVGTNGSILIGIENPNSETYGSFSGVFAGTLYATAGNIGGASAGWVIDSNRLESRGTTKKIVMDGTDGQIYIGTYGTGVYNGASTPFYVDRNGYFSLGNKLTFNPVTNVLDVNGTITADAGNIAGWSILPNRLSSGTGSSSVSLASSGGTSIYAGSSNPAVAPFKVTNTGILTATGVDLSGRLVATSGSIGGWNITAASISSSGATPIILDSNGKITIGNTNWGNSANYFYVANDGKFGLGNKLTWDTSTLLIDGVITSASGVIGGWNIGTKRLYAGASSTYVELSTDEMVEYRTWAGHPTAASAPFRVKRDGTLIASGASINGAINATSGTFSGSITAASISGSTITGGSISGNTISGGSITGASLTAASISGGQISIGSGFSVNPAGVLTATGACITGGINSTSGSIGGFLIGPTSLTAGTGSSAVGLQSTGTYPVWAGNPDSFVAPFSVRYDGFVTASSVSVLNFYNTAGSIPSILQGQFQVDAGKVAIGRQIGTGASSSGLYINKTVGTTNDPLWDNYWYSSGRFRVGSPTGYMTFDGSGSLVVSGSITGSSVSGTSITGSSISGTTITAGSISGNTITGGSISGASITAASITGGSINGALITAGSINAARITGGSISGALVTAGSISGNTITGGSISGTLITAGSISGNTITGGTITGSSVSGAYVTGGSVMGMYVNGGSVDIGTNPSVSFHIDSAGNVWTGASSNALSTAPFRLYNDGSIDIGGNDATSLHINAIGNVYAGTPKADPSVGSSAASISGTITGLSGSILTINTVSAHNLSVDQEITATLIGSSPTNVLNFTDYSVLSTPTSTSLTVANPVFKSISAASATSGSVTYTTSTNHNFRIGASVTIAGVGGGTPGFNGIRTIGAINAANTFVVVDGSTGTPVPSSATAVMTTTHTGGGQVRRIPPFHVQGSDGAVRASLVVSSDRVSGSSNHLNLSNVLNVASNITIGDRTLFATDSYSSYDEGFNFSLSAANGFNARVNTTSAIQINASGYTSILPISTSSSSVTFSGLPTITATTGYQAVYRNNLNQSLALFTSQRALKENIVDISDSGSLIDLLRPVNFVASATGEETPDQTAERVADIQFGFIAEEVAEASGGKLASYAIHDGEKVPVVWRIPDMIALAIAELKDLRQRVSALETQ